MLRPAESAAGIGMQRHHACDSEKSFVPPGRMFDDVRVFQLMWKSHMRELHFIHSSPGARSAIEACQAELQLDHGSHFRLRAAQDMRLMPVRGVAWITLEEEAGEAVVRPGETFVVPSGKTALVGPLHESVKLELGIALDVPAALPATPASASCRKS
jgi:hypothetical protein